MASVLFDFTGSFCITTNTAPQLRQLLQDIFRAWFSNGDDTEDIPDIMHHPARIRQRIVQQTAIGWQQLFNGRFSTQWGLLQDDYLYRTHAKCPSTTTKITGTQWQTKLILHIWEQWRGVWKLQNESLHWKDTTRRATAEAKEIKRRLEEIYDLRGHMEPSAQALLCGGIQQHLQKPLWMAHNWFQIPVPLFQASMRRVKARAIQGVRNIRTYFGPQWRTSSA